jgi:hypothetical protein
LSGGDIIGIQYSNCQFTSAKCGVEQVLKENGSNIDVLQL